MARDIDLDLGTILTVGTKVLCKAGDVRVGPRRTADSNGGLASPRTTGWQIGDEGERVGAPGASPSSLAMPRDGHTRPDLPDA